MGRVGGWWCLEKLFKSFGSPVSQEILIGRGWGWVLVVSGIMIQTLLFGSSVLSFSEYIPRGRDDGVGVGA